MIDVILLAGRVLLVALLFLFLYTVMRTGIGLVKGQSRRFSHWMVSVARGPREVVGMKLAVTGPVVVGRAAGSDIMVGAEYVSGRHARLMPLEDRLVLEDLGSTNGTRVNGEPVTGPVELIDGDSVQIGDVVLQVQQL
jgi:hypothetical protein